MCPAWLRFPKLLMLASAVALVAAAETPVSAQALRVTASSRGDLTRRMLDSAARKFLDEWGVLWRRSQSTALPAKYSIKRERATSIADEIRKPYFHCHRPNIPDLAEKPTRYTEDYAPIPAVLTTFSVCPTWRLHDEPTFPDEDGNIDGALLPSFHSQATNARAKLLDVLARSTVDNPRDNFMVGQWVRFLLDQQLPDSAYAVVRSCAADRWWCLTLQGYTEFQMGRVRDAANSFAEARVRMTPPERCRWDDITLLTPTKLIAYSDDSESETQCYSRDLFTTRYWWLSDPMWSVAGNERRVEHNARTVQLRLRAGFSHDGRTHWGPDKGGDAVQRMVLRYGWPSYLAWGGPVGDVSHTNWLVENGSPKQPPYTTYEYERGRVHTAPRWEMLDNPFAASDSAWQLNEPRNFSWRKRWWPDEFSKRATPLTQLPRGQTAMLRRNRDIILALATETSALDSVRVRDGSPAHLLIAYSPDSIELLATSPFRSNGTTFGRGRIGPFPALLALEAREAVPHATTASPAASALSNPPQSDSVIAEARTRFAIVPPATLEEMRAGEVAVSEAVLLRLPENAELVPARADSLLDQMLGSVIINLRATPKVGVYWETYGVGARDSVTVGVRIERRVTVGGVRRLGMALGLASDPNAAVNITWREPDIGRVTTTINGTVPIQSRTVTLDLTRLEPGPYDVVMSIAKIRGTPATSVKRIVIAR